MRSQLARTSQSGKSATDDKDVLHGLIGLVDNGSGEGGSVLTNGAQAIMLYRQAQVNCATLRGATAVVISLASASPDLLTEIMRVRRLEFQGGQSINMFSSDMNHPGMQLQDSLDEQKGFLGDDEPVLFKNLWTDDGV
jgi:hypothetical protein